MTTPADLHAAMVEADSRYYCHWSVCRANAADLLCLKCHQLEQIALDAADAYQAALVCEAVGEAAR